jgi:hypothetical protein
LQKEIDVSRWTIAASAVFLGCFALPLGANAQDAAGPADPGNEKINQLIVYGDDPCPQATSANEITVCARKEESERYRIPEPLRGIDQPENRAWTDRVLAYETVGKTGTLSCTPVGPGGYTGCAQKLINNAYAERKTGPDVTFSNLIAQERAKRLSTTDEEAKATQARVEAEEKAYEAKHPGSMDSTNATDAQTQTPPATSPTAPTAAPASSAPGASPTTAPSDSQK